MNMLKDQPLPCHIHDLVLFSRPSTSGVRGKPINWAEHKFVTQDGWSKEKFALQLQVELEFGCISVDKGRIITKEKGVDKYLETK